MNVKLLLKHIDAAVKSVEVPKLKADGSNAIDFYQADVVGNKRFAQNYGCWPRSEIAEINAQADIAMKAALLNDLQDMSSSADDATAGMTDVQIMLGHKSKYCQAPSEVQRWLEGQLEIRDAQRSQAKTVEDQKINFDDSETPSENE